MAERQHVPPEWRHNLKNSRPCPRCGKGSDSDRRGQGSQHERCYGFTKPDGWTTCTVVVSDRPVREGLGGWWHWAGDGFAGEPIFTVYETTDERADPDVRHAVYSWLLARLGLDDGDPHGDNVFFSGGDRGHLGDLLDRGLSETEIRQRWYASHRREGRREIAAAMVAEFGEATLRDHLPGLYWSKRGNTDDERPDLAGTTGILVPFRDVERRIVGLQIRADQATATHGRYSWFSSIGKEGGCGSGSPIHISSPIGPMTDARLWVTEGPIKADIASTRRGAVFAAMPGVSSGRAEVIDTARQLHAPAAVIAFDRDAETNPHVMLARDALASEFAAAGFPVLLAEWDDASKGIDDAIIAGVEITIRPYPLQRRAGQMEKLPPEAVPMTPPRKVHTVEEIRFLTENMVDQIVTHHPPTFFAFTSMTGVGKTGSVARRVRQMYDAGRLPWVEKKSGKGKRPARIVYLAQTKELVAEFVAETGGLAMTVEGRNPDPGHDWGCHRPEQITLIGEHRHNPAVDVCLSCKEQYEAVHGHGWLCNYLSMKKVAEEHAIVAAPMASFFNASSDLRNFDVIIADEHILPSLTETQILTADHIAQWRQRMDALNAATVIIDGAPVTEPRYGPDDPFRYFVDLLGLVAADGVESADREWTSALPTLLRREPDLGQLLADLNAAAQTAEKDRGRFAFEDPRGINGPDPLVPLRLCQDLIAAIALELNRPEGADTRLWLTPEGLRLFIVHDHLIEILRKRTVINLDATPSPLLTQLFPDRKEVRYDAPAPTIVTQITDVIATRSQLAGESNRRRDRIVEALDRVTTSAISPTVFTFKSLDPNVPGDGPRIRVSNPSAAYGHFDSETRGLNRFSATDVLAIVGRYSAPLTDLRATVQGVRFLETPPRPTTDTRDTQGRPLKLRPYHWRDDNGSGLGRWSAADDDPDVDALVRWSEASTIVQAIGRGRAVLRSEAAPLRVYLFSNNPVADLTVDHLTTLAALGAPGTERQTPPGFYDARDERNSEAEADCRQRVDDALAALRESGEPITVSAVARSSGVNRRRMYKNATLQALIEQAQIRSNQLVTEGVSPSTVITAPVVTMGVPPSTVNDIYRHDQGGTPSMTAETLATEGLHDQEGTPTVTVNPPVTVALHDQDAAPSMTDLATVRPALNAADQAQTRDELHRATDDLAAKLATLAAAKGKQTIPKSRFFPPPSSADVAS